MSWVWGLALLVAVLPVWVARDLPMVDLPQHLYVLEALQHLQDTATPYPAEYELQVRFTPYVGYYAVVGSLGSWMPLETANRIWLTLVVLAYPLAVAFLLASLRRPRWPALLAAPLAYGDSFAWGFVNTLGATPLAVFATALFLRGIERPSERTRTSVLFAIAALATFFTHPAPVAFLALALPWLLLTTRSPEDTPGGGVRGWLGPRWMLLAGALTLAIALVAWLVTSSSDPTTTSADGSPLRAILAPGNIVRETLSANLGAFFWLLANQFQSGMDQAPLLATLVLVALAVVARLFEDPPSPTEPITTRERLLPWGLVLIAFGLFLAMPLTVRGHIMYLSPRFAALTAMLALVLVPRLGPRSIRILFAGASLVVATSGVLLSLGFREFAREAAALRSLAPACSDRPRILGLTFDAYSRVVHRPVHLHGAAVLARLRHGVPNYSLLGGSHIPLRHRQAPPPNVGSEWEPHGFDYERLGRAYDHFLLRGASPDSVFGSRLGDELLVAGRAGEWSLVKRRGSETAQP